MSALQIGRDFDYQTEAPSLLLNVIRDGKRVRLRFRNRAAAFKAHKRFLEGGAEYLDTAIDGQHYRWIGAPVEDFHAQGRAPIIAGLTGDSFEVTPTAAAVARCYFDARADRALRGTITGESMASWGPRYVREARAALTLASVPGQLWARVAR